jgi:hypothetical protein
MGGSQIHPTGTEGTMTTYEIRQTIRAADKNEFRAVALFGGDFGRMARMEYDRLIREYPNEYFELIKVEHVEECLDFVGNKEPTP